MSLDGCPCCGETLDKLVRPAVLTALAAGPLHGYLIAKRIERLRISRGCCPDTTGIYRALHSMQEDDFVSARWDTKGAGPARRLYRLTPRGRQCLKRWAGTLVEYEAAIRQLLVAARKAARRARPARKAHR